mgnify:CR=1 FL=1
MRAVLKKWGMAFLEWLFTGVAFGLGVLFVAAGVGMVYNEFNKKKCRHLDEVNKHKIP